MKHHLTFKGDSYAVALNPDGSAVLWKDNHVWGIGVWRCNYVLWQGERQCKTLKLLDVIDGELREIVKERLPQFWQKDFYDTVKISAYQSTLSLGVSVGG